MTTAYSFASKTTNTSTAIDSIIGILPRTHESSLVPPSTSSFRTTTTSPSTFNNDPELYMGDDSDCDYAQALMQSGMFSTNTSLSSSSMFDQDSDCSDTDDQSQVSIQRLRLLLAHLNPHTASSAKGKSKAFF